MEQTNMMPNGMGGPNQPLNTMQRPQPGNIQQQIYAKVLTDLRNESGQFVGTWQATLDIRERAAQIVQLISALRLLEPVAAKCVAIAQRFEHTSITTAQNKQQYEQMMQNKMEEIRQKRQQNAQTMQNNVMMGNMAQQNQLPVGMPMQNGGMMQNGQMNSLSNLQAFPAHLQRPMQPSPLQQQAQQRNQQNDPIALHNQSQINPQMLQNPNRPANNMPQNPTGMPSAQNNPQMELQIMAQRMMAALSEQKKNEVRHNLFQNMTEQQRQNFATQRVDPLKQWIINRAKSELRQQQNNMQNAQQQQQPQTQQSRPNNAGLAGSSQGMPGNANLQQQPPNSNQSGNNFNISHLYGQQANALKMQESGEQVVPVSNNVNFPFGGLMNGQNQQGQNNGSAGMMPTGSQTGAQVNQSMTGPDAQRQAHLLMQQQQQQQQQREAQEHIIQQRNLISRQRAIQQQQHAAARQANALQGQPGGLNASNAFNAAPAGSPAMSMLNRPMQPPGSQTPNTPPLPNRLQNGQPAGQPNNQQGSVSDANALAQHHQNMVSQNNPGMPNQPNAVQAPMPAQAMQNWLHSLEPQARNRVLSMPPEQRMQVLHRARQHAQQQQQQQQHAQQQQQIQQLQQNVQQNATLQGVSDQGPVLNGMMDFGALQQQQHQAQKQVQPNAENAIQRQQRPQQLRNHAMLSRQFPRQVLAQLGIDVPLQIQLWGQLRAHIIRNSNIYPPDMAQRVVQAMESHFAANENDLRQAVNELVARHQAQQRRGQGGQLPGANMNMPNGGQAPPPAQMTAPVAPMQQAFAAPQADLSQQSQFANQSQPQVSQQDIARLRLQLHAGPHVSDEKLQAILINKLRVGQNAQVSQNGAQQNQQFQQANMAQTFNRSQPPGRAPVQSKSGPQPQQQVQKRPAQNSGNDDIIEIPNPNGLPLNGSAPPQAPTIQQASSQQQQQQPPQMRRPALPPPEQLAKMPREQQLRLQKQMQALQNRTQGVVQGGKSQSQPLQQTATSNTAGLSSQFGTQALPESKTLAQRLWGQLQPLPPKGPPVKAEQQAINELKVLFKKMWKSLQALEQTFPLALRSIPGFDEQKAKELLKIKYIMMQNILDEEGNIREHLSTPVQELKHIAQRIMKYYQDLARFNARNPQLNGAQTMQPQALIQQQKPPFANQPQPNTAPPMAPTKSQTGGQRKQSSNTKPPAAPTDEKKFWGPSPQGIPRYEQPKTELTQDKLKFPAQKKRKTGQSESQASTPANLVSTPGAAIGTTPNLTSGKVISPQSATKVPIKADEPEKPKWRCTKSDLCDASINGFNTEAELMSHIESAHKVVEDPLQYLLDSASDALGLDSEGKPLQSVVTSQKAAQTKAKPLSKSALRKDLAQTVATQAGQSGTPNTPGTAGKGSIQQQTPVAQGKTAIPAVAEKLEESAKTLRESMSEKLGFSALPSAIDQPSENAMDLTGFGLDDSLWVDVGDTIMSGLNDWDLLGDLGDTKIDDWGLRPVHLAEPLDFSSPELTPSDKESQSSQTSDVSANDQIRLNLEWDAFENGDIYVPEILKVRDLGLGDAGKATSLDHAITTEDNSGDRTKVTNKTDGVGAPASGEKAVSKGEVKKADDEWDWTSDLVEWDDLYGLMGGMDTLNPAVRGEEHE